MSLNEPTILVFVAGLLLSLLANGMLMWRNQFLLRADIKALQALINQKVDNNKAWVDYEFKRIDEALKKIEERIVNLEKFRERILWKLDSADRRKKD